MANVSPSSSPKYSILITSFRSLRFLDDCLGSLLKLTGPTYEILFLENGSPEPEAEWIENHIQDSRLRVFRLSKTRYFTGGIQFLAERAQGEFIVLLNSDTRVNPNWLEVLDDYLLATGYEGANSDVRQMSHPDEPENGKFCLDPLGLTHFLPLLRTKQDAPLIAGGCGLAVKRNLFNELGGLDDDYKMYFEDIDLCWRFGLADYRIGYAPGAILHHAVGGSSVNTFFLWNRFRDRRNRISSFLKNAGPLLLAVFIPGHFCIWLGTIAKNLLTGNFRAVLVESAALTSVLFHLRATLSKRRAVQRTRKLTDAEIMRRGFMIPRFKFVARLFGV